MVLGNLNAKKNDGIRKWAFFLFYKKKYQQRFGAEEYVKK